MLSRETLDELKDILREDFERTYTDDEVFAIAQGLVGIFDRLMEFDFKDNNEYENERMHKTIPLGG